MRYLGILVGNIVIAIIVYSLGMFITFDPLWVVNGEPKDRVLAVAICVLLSAIWHMIRWEKYDG